MNFPSDSFVPTDHTIHLDLPHRIRFTRGAFDASNPTLADILDVRDEPVQPKLWVVVDQGVVESTPELQRDLESYVAHHADWLPRLVGFRAMPGGEQIKNDLSLLESLLGEMNRLGIDRRSTVLAIGGGALLDMVGFAAAVTHRGIRLVRMPTTTLAQGDSGVGVKNGVNMFGKKNFIGTFAVPHAVVNDLALLDTLSDRDWRCGLAEAVKVALLKDADFYTLLRDHADDLTCRSTPLSDEVWQRSAQLHLQHITASKADGGGGDPFENLSARPLDFGHWSAHKLEQLTGYELRHGEAVAIGLALDVTYAAHTDLLALETATEIKATLNRMGFALSHPELSNPSLLDGLNDFREHLGGQLTVTMIRGVADPIDLHEIDTAVMQRCIDELLSAGQPAPR
ncbi:MAG: 3-dehydroquinate synthase [Planctomycetota bacterium]